MENKKNDKEIKWIEKELSRLVEKTLEMEYELELIIQKK